MKILLSVIMIYAGFTPTKLKILLKQLLMFYLISFIFGGCAFALLYFINPKEVFIKNGVFVGQYPIKIALLSGVVGFVIIQISFRFIKNKMNKQNMICTIKIYIRGKTLEVKALVDSGNFLKDPISNIPVIVVEKTKLYGILPNIILDNLDNLNLIENLTYYINENFNESGNEVINHEKLEKKNISEYMSRIRVVPFSSLGKPNGLLVGIKADEIHVINLEGEQTKTNAIVGIYDKTLTQNGNYSALIGLDILEGRENNEFVTNNKI